MRSRASILFRVVAVCALLNLGGGACMGGCCGSAEVGNYESASRNARMHELETWVYERPIAEVWPVVVSVLAESGYELAEKDPAEGKTLETSFKPAHPGEYRILVNVVRLDAKRYRVLFDRQYRHKDEDGGVTLTVEAKNAGEMEAVELAWRVAERAEPARALEAQSRVKAKAERAGAVGRGCDRGCAACGNMVPVPPPQQ